MEGNSPLKNLNSNSNPLNQAEAPLENLFKNVPALPSNVRNFLAIITPYLALVWAIFTAFGLLSLIRLAGWWSTTALDSLIIYSSAYIWTSIIVGGLGLILVILALAQGLLKKSRAGWKFLFYAQCINLIGGVIMGILLGSVTNLISTAIVSAIAFYILFQIKEYYK
jgi:hypothetical protein